MDPSNPIVLLRACSNDIAVAVHPGLETLGILLPSSGLHARLCESVGRPLVCTSANREGEPLEYEVQAAQTNLVDIADVWLHHDRPIVRPIDDSVVRVIADRRVTIRLGRGLAPLPLSLPLAKPQVAVGGHMKSAVAWHNGSQAALGPHIGDLNTVACRERSEKQVADVEALYRFVSSTTVHDSHPDYFTTRWAQGLSLPSSRVQHHFAHIAAGMLEHGLLDRDAFGVSWDGTGFGDDGNIWGGEFFTIRSGTEYSRVAHLRPFPWFGGETMVYQPWRSAVLMLNESLVGDEWIDRAASLWQEQTVVPFVRLTRRTEDCVRSTSVGRLFDAVAAIVLGLEVVHYEGQAAMMLEAVASPTSQRHYPLSLVDRQLDWRPMLRQIWMDQEMGLLPGEISAKFHRSLAIGILNVASLYPHFPIVLGGGVFQNKLLTEMIAEMVSDPKRLKLPGSIPPNDGGLAAGQLAISVMREQRRLRHSHT